MVQVYESPQELNGLNQISLFLAGGIDRAPDWQKDAIAYLNHNHDDLNLAVLNPRRSTPFSKDDYESRIEQVTWEFENLRHANSILFWFPDNAPCTTSLFELGFWINHFKTFVGVNPGHYKERSIKMQISLLNNLRKGHFEEVKVENTLENTLDNAINYLRTLHNDIQF